MFLFIFREKWREEKRKGEERNIAVRESLIGCLPHEPWLGTEGTFNLGMCPNRELFPKPFAAQDDALINWANRPGQDHHEFLWNIFIKKLITKSHHNVSYCTAENLLRLLRRNVQLKCVL